CCLVPRFRSPRTPRPPGSADLQGGKMNTTRALSVACAAWALDCMGAYAAEEAHWSYGEHGGPKEWGALKSEFATCKVGKVQSPIDIRGAKAADLPAIK